MAETDIAPLSDDEREELEALRAEKARREEEERIRAEREELAALRAEQERVDAQILRERAEEAAHVATPAPTSAPAPAKPAPARAAKEQKPVVDPDNMTFAQKMVLGDDAGKDSDEVPGMPPAQKIIIAICVVAIAFFIYYLVTR